MKDNFFGLYFDMTQCTLIRLFFFNAYILQNYRAVDDEIVLKVLFPF